MPPALNHQLMVKFAADEVAAEVPPPYVPPGTAGLVTVTGTTPAVMIALLGICAVTTPALIHEVVMAAPLKLTTALLPKFAPFTVNTKATLPWLALLGISELIVGVVPAIGGVVE